MISGLAFPSRFKPSQMQNIPRLMSRQYCLLFLISLKFQFCCISRDGENVEENVIREYINVPLNWPYARNITFRLLYVTLMLPPRRLLYSQFAAETNTSSVGRRSHNFRLYKYPFFLITPHSLQEATWPLLKWLLRVSFLLPLPSSLCRVSGFIFRLTFNWFVYSCFLCSAI